MSEEKKNLDNLQITQDTDNELNLEELDNVAGGQMIAEFGTQIFPQEPNQEYKRKLSVLDE